MTGIPNGRGVSPVLGVLLLVAITVLLAAVVVAGAGSLSLSSAPPTASFALEAEESKLHLEHTGGDPIDVETLSMTVSVDGVPLEQQPSVPFAGAPGFDGSPDGPLNDSSENTWRPGERSTLTVAGTNDPALSSGDTVGIDLVVDGERIASLETTAV